MCCDRLSSGNKGDGVLDGRFGDDEELPRDGGDHQGNGNGANKTEAGSVTGC